MGQTLTHGVYLPDEGERNCYAGLAANWQILDTSVGTVAEHTTQIAGKAPLVHTHTKADITDFPVYGTTAGTICEGNDSRLSDARTPVAHTHTKSDVTDLLNSNFVPSVNNSYDLGTSTNKWKTLNGINPGALSFPNMDYSDTNKWKDIRGDITNQTGGDNWYTPTEDGWIFIIANGNPTVLTIFVKAGTASAGRACLGCGSDVETASGARWLYCPAPKGSVARIRYAKGTGILEAAWFITCQGNV